MWRSATSSSALIRGRPARTWLALAAAAALAGAVRPVAAQERLSQDEALRLAFPAPLVIERRTAYLDERQLARARELAGSGIEVDQRVVTYYVALDSGRPAGVAYFDAHRVRTLPEVVMFVVGPDARIRRAEVFRFAEPPEYRAPDGWLAQLQGRRLDADLSVRRAIVNMTGATLTAEAVTRAARRVLALHTVIAPFGAPR